MCGRYTLRELALLRQGLGLEASPDFEEFTEHVDPRKMFNISPGQRCPVVRLNKEDKPAIGIATWGLIPSWTKGKPAKAPFNARDDKVATSGLYREAFKRRRCLVPVDGFYEWKGPKRGEGPHYIRMRDDGLFMFAGLWERWKADDQSDPIDTFTVITTTPNELMQPLHDRMPVILAQQDYARWLDRNNTSADVADLLKPFASEGMEAWPISTKVNKPREFDGPQLIERE